jgi:hypothetical protein
MLNPFGSQREPSLSSHVNLKQRLLQNVQAASVNDQIFLIVQKAFEDALNKENIPLIRTERKRLFVQIMKQVLIDMVEKLDKSS